MMTPLKERLQTPVLMFSIGYAQQPREPLMARSVEGALWTSMQDLVQYSIENAVWQLLRDHLQENYAE